MNGATNGTSSNPLDHFDLRDLSASLLKHLCTKFAKFAHNLKPRLARSCLKTFLDPRKTLGAQYGAILGFGAVGGGEIVRNLVVPNLKEYDDVLRGPMSGSEGEIKRLEAEKVVGAILRVLQTVADEDAPMMNGHGHGSVDEERLKEKVGEVLAERLNGDPRMAKAVLES